MNAHIDIAADAAKKTAYRNLNLALQGTGSHGAFGWGVLDKLLEDGRIGVEGIAATGAGAMNAVVYAFGHMKDGRDGARELLEQFWKKTSTRSTWLNPMHRSPMSMFAEPLARRWQWGDLVVLLGIVVLLYAGVSLAIRTPRALRGPDIALAPAVLPYYALCSLGRWSPRMRSRCS